MAWTNHFRGVLDWATAGYDDIMTAIQAELLFQDPKLTRRQALFSLQMNKGETLKELITRDEITAAVCYLQEGLSHDKILILCILWAVPQELCSKIFQ